MTDPFELDIYQWNCRSLNSKKAQLSLYIALQPPDVIVLQEADTPKAELRCYSSFTQDSGHRTAILVAQHITAQEHLIASEIAHTFVEILPPRPNVPSVYILSVYSPPLASLKSIDRLIHEASRKSQQNPLILLGDFNPPHHSWGYRQASKKRHSRTTRFTKSFPHPVQ